MQPEQVLQRVACFCARYLAKLYYLGRYYSERQARTSMSIGKGNSGLLTTTLVNYSTHPACTPSSPPPWPPSHSSERQARTSISTGNRDLLRFPRYLSGLLKYPHPPPGALPSGPAPPKAALPTHAHPLPHIQLSRIADPK